MMKLVLAQVEARRGDKEANLARMEDIVSGHPCDLAVFPEMFLTSYNVRDDVQTQAEPLDGPSVAAAREMAARHGTHLVFGMPEVSPTSDGVIYDSAVLCCPDGTVGAYRKLHLANFGPFEEKLYFGAGRETPVFRTDLGTIGLQICYDLFFPELSKIYALKGADVVINISATPTFSKELFEAAIPARAIENTVFFIYANNTGSQRNLVFWGGDRVVGPRGDVKAIAEPYEEAVLECVLDLSEIRTARQFRPTIRDTNPAMLERIGEALKE